ncbi:TonB-dependent receptor domain-containing protein [Snodgrassella sp. CFCC 13594]|uniref:TonB-dependent receptor domain-containing protein n=1 Tax=Snodgrassella sp. CFCC 13594 TaxID=1775559 RepID=UPI0012E8DCFA|nr:TonB-dependent receptor [Snodgrassella sp. CFCC 13594]
MLSGAAALSRGDWRGMVLATWRKGQETDNRGDVGGQGSNRTEPDPLDYNSRYFLTKHEYDINEHHSLSFVAEYLSRNQWMDAQSQLTSRITSYNALDENKRTRLSLGHHYQNDDGPVQDIQTQLYWQKSETNSDTYQNGTSFTSSYYRPKGYRQQVFNNQDQVWGLGSNWVSRIDGDGLKQIWRYGVDVAYHDLSSDWQSNYHYAKSKPTADSKMLQMKLYVDGDLDFNQLVVSPGLSAHYYRYSPSTNGYVTNTTNSVADLGKQHDFELTPRLGLAWKINPLFEPYVQYSRGFKAPSAQQLGTSFNPGFYSVWGNPELKPETANNFELGLRGKNDVLEYGIAAFNNKYKNFIDLVELDARLAGQYVTYQYKNLEDAHIYGGEAFARWKFAPNWLASGSLAYSRGTFTNEGVKSPLNSVTPVKVKLGIAYNQETWGTNVDFTYAAAKKDKDIYNATFNPSKSYALVDFGGYWKPNKHLSINAGINNIFNQKYWNWSDISYFLPNANTSQNDATVSMTSTNADRYTATGRNFNVGVRYTF